MAKAKGGKGMKMSSPMMGKTVGKVQADKKKPMEYHAKIMKSGGRAKGQRGKGKST
jgi:hypothetical protein